MAVLDFGRDDDLPGDNLVRNNFNDPHLFGRRGFDLQIAHLIAQVHCPAR